MLALWLLRTIPMPSSHTANSREDQDQASLHTSCRGFEVQYQGPIKRPLSVDVGGGVFMFEHWHYLSVFIVIHLPPPTNREAVAPSVSVGPNWG